MKIHRMKSEEECNEKLLTKLTKNNKIVPPRFIFWFLPVVILLSVFVIGVHVNFSNLQHVDSHCKNEKGKLSHTATRAVVHMGPHKTGTSSIQAYSRLLKDELKQDGYEMPWNVVQEKNGRRNAEGKNLEQNQVNLATCFIPETASPPRKKFHCDPNLLLYGLGIAKRNSNLFVSAETFDRIDHEGVILLKEYLSSWDEVKIIIYYRIWYSWLVSMYHQTNKMKRISSRKSLLDFLEGSTPSAHIFTPNLIRRLKSVFDDEEIVLRNMHDDSSSDGAGLLQSFYCDAVLNATHACDAIKSGEKRMPRSNVSPNFDYDDLALAARNAGLIQFDDANSEQTRMITEAIRAHQEGTLNLSSKDFKRVCPPQETLDMIWNMTLASEVELFPDLYVNFTLGESNLRKGFDLAAVTSLCVVDVDQTLYEETWQTFFKYHEVSGKGN